METQKRARLLRQHEEDYAKGMTEIMTINGKNRKVSVGGAYTEILWSHPLRYRINLVTTENKLMAKIIPASGVQQMTWMAHELARALGCRILVREDCQNFPRTPIFDLIIDQ